MLYLAAAAIPFLVGFMAAAAGIVKLVTVLILVALEDRGYV
tara:strand:- start:2231 stop:2353 length:123 start_codon:yes stop_codon:yes gene_type:complete